MLARERQLAIEEARAVADVKEKVRRYLEERQEQRRDKYFNRKLQLFNIGRGIKADAIGELNQSLAGVTAGNDIALATRNQYCDAILSSFGGLIGAGMNFFGGSANGVNVPQSTKQPVYVAGCGYGGSRRLSASVTQHVAECVSARHRYRAARIPVRNAVAGSSSFAHQCRNSAPGEGQC
jgi:hypothetical protein